MRVLQLAEERLFWAWPVPGAPAAVYPAIVSAQLRASVPIVASLADVAVLTLPYLAHSRRPVGVSRVPAPGVAERFAFPVAV